MLAIFIVLSLVSIVVARFFTKSWINPLTIFSGIWLFITLLYQFRLSGFQISLSDDTYSLLTISTLSFAIFYLLGYFFSFKRSNHDSWVEKKQIVISEKSLISMFTIWLLLTFVEIIYSGGLPALWLLAGSTKTYFDFGIPSLHGFLNALGLVIMSISFYLVLTKNKNLTHLKTIIIILCIYYLLLITRQVLINAIVQMITIYILVRGKASLKKAVLVFVICLICFGIVGNFRTGYEAFMSRALIDTQLPGWLSGVYWVYMYTTMTIANINNMISMSINFGGIQPIIQNFLPSIISEFFQAETTLAQHSIIVSPNFNVSGYFAPFYLGLGTAGVVFIASLYGLIGGISYQKVVKVRSTRNILIYVVVFQIIVLSFFVNMLFYLPSVFQIIIILWIFRKSKSEALKLDPELREKLA